VKTGILITGTTILILGIIIGFLITKNKIVGQYTVSDIVELGENAINQCQKDLPRSKQCQLVITAKVEDKTIGAK